MREKKYFPNHPVVVVVFDEWLKRRHSVLTLHLTQVLTGHGSFGRYLFLIRRDDIPGCPHCVDRPEDMVEHILEVCHAWAEHSALVEAIAGGDHSCPALVQAIVWGEATWEAVTSFCEAVIERRSSSSATAGDALGVRDHGVISYHRGCGFADGEQWVAHRTIRTEPASMVRYVSKNCQHNLTGPDSVDCLLELRKRLERKKQLKEQDGYLVSKSLTLSFAPPRARGVLPPDDCS